MARLNIYVVPTGRLLSKDFNFTTHTVDRIISMLQDANEIPPPAGDAAGGTIWKMTKGSKSNSAIGDCTPDPGFVEGETVYLILAPA